MKTNVPTTKLVAIATALAMMIVAAAIFAGTSASAQSTTKRKPSAGLREKKARAVQMPEPEADESPLAADPPETQSARATRLEKAKAARAAAASAAADGEEETSGVSRPEPARVNEWQEPLKPAARHEVAAAPMVAKPAAAKASVAPADATTTTMRTTTTWANLASLKPAAELKALELPSGTAVRMKLDKALSSRSNRIDDPFSARVSQDVVVNGRTVIPSGSTIQGTVARVRNPRRIKGLPTLDLRPQQVTLPNGNVFSINAVVVDTAQGLGLDVDDEGRIKGPGHQRHDLVEIGAGAGVGAGVGAAIGGGVGAGVGAAIGAGAASVHWLTRSHSVEIPAGTEIILELSRSMSMAASD